MSSTSTIPAVIALGDEKWEPLEIEGVRTGDIHWIVGPTEGSTRTVAVWRVLAGDAPDSWKVTFESAEVMHVLEGQLEITVDGEEPVVLKPGEVAYYPEGVQSTWRITEYPLRKVYMSV
ncbi:MAG: cupin domain-containing protein [Rhodococcus sp. (in: high G+C Gram-positive bacteria)]